MSSNAVWIEFFLEIGMLPDGDFTGGAMSPVIDDNTGRLTPEDRRAMLLGAMFHQDSVLKILLAPEGKVAAPQHEVYPDAAGGISEPDFDPEVVLQPPTPEPPPPTTML